MPTLFQPLAALAIAIACLSGQLLAASELIERKALTHWAFQAIANPPLPAVSDSAWPRDHLDHFVLARLESNQLSPSPVSDRRSLLRRAYIGLTGLQPSYQQTQAFLDDRSPDAFAKVVDQLLASPQYGERWARHWLDVARYADTKGYVFEEARQYPYAYTYRDWVIRALNEDMPYDQFLTYQIAADQAATGEDNAIHLAAMGFLTVGRRFLNRQPDIIDDRIDVVTRGMMALTIACSRCHDHKYDPVPTADYYSLYGIFASSEEPEELPLLGKQPVSPESKKFERELKLRLAKVDQHLQKRLDDQREEEQLKQYLIALRDGRDANDGDLKKLAAQRGLVQGILLRWRDHIARAPADDPVFAPWKACFELTPNSFATEAPKRLGSILMGGKLNPRVSLALEGKELGSIADLATAYAKLLAHDNRDQAHDDGDREQIRLVLHGSGTPNDLPLDRLSDLLPTPDQKRVRKLRREVKEFIAGSPGAPPRGMVMTDRASPIEPYIFIRGQKGNRGPKVPRQFPAIVAGSNREPFPSGTSGRLEMAILIASRDNPLTARVIVNRVWAHHFGQPLVSTPSDFGLRSDPPSHPQLLDFLAHRFIEEGWSLKTLHRHLLLSATYQQSSANSPNKAAIDPENLLLWRMNRQRLDFESLRDTLIQASGRLDQTMFGRPYKIAKEPFTLRRTIYSEVERQNLENVFRTFDFASPDAHCPQRYQTTVPQQALFLMNSPFIGQLASGLATSPSMLSMSLPADKIRHLYRRIFGRAPDPAELEIGQTFLRASLEAPAATSTWSYGYGSDQDPEVRFTAFPNYVDGRYQGGSKLPDPETGWASLSRSGGHPGHGPHHQAILRFTAPEAGHYKLGTNIRVPAQMSDGVTFTAIVDGKVEHAKRQVPAQQALPLELNLSLAAGQTLDLIIGSGRTVNHDSFQWDPEITNHDTQRHWRLSDSFAPPKPPVSPYQIYAQALLSSNEFAFID